MNTNSPTVLTFTPTMLATFERCPSQYHLKYVRKLRPSNGPNSNLACGSAAHRVLAVLFTHYRHSDAFPIDLRTQIATQLPRDQYDSDNAWEADAERMLSWIKWVLTAFDGTARIVAIERSFEYLFPGKGDYPAFRLRHTVDLVLEHPDGSIEHVDWKTGNGYRIEDLHNVCARIVVGQAFPGQPHILSSTAFLASQATRTDELTFEAVKAVWGRIKELARAIMTERDWQPISNPLCPWCPFYGHGCPLYPTIDSPDAMTDWLESVA